MLPAGAYIGLGFSLCCLCAGLLSSNFRKEQPGAFNLLFGIYGARNTHLRLQGMLIIPSCDRPEAASAARVNCRTKSLKNGSSPCDGVRQRICCPGCWPRSQQASPWA